MSPITLITNHAITSTGSDHDFISSCRHHNEEDQRQKVFPKNSDSQIQNYQKRPRNEPDVTEK